MPLRLLESEFKCAKSLNTVINVSTPRTFISLPSKCVPSKSFHGSDDFNISQTSHKLSFVLIAHRPASIQRCVNNPYSSLQQQGISRSPSVEPLHFRAINQTRIERSGSSGARRAATQSNSRCSEEGHRATDGRWCSEPSFSCHLR